MNTSNISETVQNLTSAFINTSITPEHLHTHSVNATHLPYEKTEFSVFSPSMLVMEAAALGLGIVTTRFLFSKTHSNAYYRNQMLKVRKSRDNKIQEFLMNNVKTADETKMNYIVNLDVVSLANKIRTKELKASEVLLAYAHRAGTLGKELCLIGDVLFESALKEAMELDERIEAGDTDLPPLAGVPICVKDQIDVKGALNTAGYISRSKDWCESDSPLVEVLRRKGAIPFVTTNVPQGLFTIETISNIWGTALNPWNRSKTTGGSSGGDAGLVASKCAPISLSSDIAGSIRVPANYCGLYGFKPTAERVTKVGTFTNFGTLPEFPYSFGPIARSMNDVSFFMQNFFGEFNDETIDNRPFNMAMYQNLRHQFYKIGVMFDTDICETAPVIQDVLTEVTTKLEHARHEVFKFPFERIKEFIDLGYQLIFNAGGPESIEETLNGEKPLPYYDEVVAVRSMPNIAVSSMTKIWTLMGKTRKAAFVHLKKRQSRLEFLKNLKKFNAMKQEILEYLKTNNYDAIICPVMPIPAADLNTGKYTFNFTHFTFFFNAMDMPAGNVPIKLCDNTNYDSRFNDEYARVLQTSVRNSQGMPVGIQVATLPKHDELCLHLMEQIDSFYRFDLNHADQLQQRLKDLKSN